MTKFQLTDDQLDIFKDLFGIKDGVIAVDVGDLDLKVWVGDSQCCYIFYDDGSVVKRLGSDGIYNFYDLITVD